MEGGSVLTAERRGAELHQLAVRARGGDPAVWTLRPALRRCSRGGCGPPQRWSPQGGQRREYFLRTQGLLGSRPLPRPLVAGNVLALSAVIFLL